MIKRIAKGMRDCSRPGLKFCERFGIAGAKLFRHAVRAHCTPFVMIAFQPNLGKVIELPVLGDVSRRQVAMIIKNGFFFREVVIETFRSASLQQEIFVDEFHGKRNQ
jgi:hypothetical protein